MDNDFYWELIITLEDKRQELESQLPNVSRDIFEEYCLLVDMLALLYERIGGLKK